jgi:hypothetical protein
MAKFYRFNPKGEILVEKTFDEVSNPFGKLREFVPVKKGKKWGVALNDTLELIVPLIYDRIEVWLFDKSERLMVWHGDEFSIIDINNNILIPPRYKFIDFENKNQQLGRASLNGKMGVINKSGEVIIEPKFNNCSILADDRIVITDLDELYLTDNKGIQITDRLKGERVNLERYKENDIWIDKYFILVNKEKYGVLNKDFTVVLDCKFDDYINLTNNDTFFVKLNGTNYILNNKNIVIKEFDFTFKFKSEHQLENGKYNYIIRKDNSYGAKCGILNENYQIVLPIEYDWIDYHNGTWNVKKGRSEYLLNKNYQVIPEVKYKEIGMFEKDGIACAKDDNLKYLFINYNGEVVSDFIFDRVFMGDRSTLNYLFETGFPNKVKTGLCGVMLDSKWGFVNLKGKLEIDLKFDEVKEFDSKLNAIVKYNGKWGVINKNGDVIIDFIYENIEKYDLENKLVISKKEDKFGLLDLNLKPIINFDFDYIKFSNNQIFTAYSKKPFSKKLPILKSIEPIELLNSKLLEKHNTLIHEDLIRVMVMAIVSGEEDNLTNNVYIIDIIRKDLNSATFISGYAGGGVCDECTFINEIEYKGEKGGFTVFDYIRDDEYIKKLVGDYICEIDEDLDEYQYKSLNHFVSTGQENIKILYSVWFNDKVDYTDISKNDKKRFKKLLKSTGGIKWKDWNFKF